MCRVHIASTSASTFIPRTPFTGEQTPCVIKAPTGGTRKSVLSQSKSQNRPNTCDTPSRCPVGGHAPCPCRAQSLQALRRHRRICPPSHCCHARSRRQHLAPPARRLRSSQSASCESTVLYDACYCFCWRVVRVGTPQAEHTIIAAMLRRS
jgi:hypothetical protein